MDVQLLPERRPGPSQAQARFTVVGVIGGGCDDCIFLEPCESVNRIFHYTNTLKTTVRQMIERWGLSQQSYHLSTQKVT